MFFPNFVKMLIVYAFLQRCKYESLHSGFRTSQRHHFAKTERYTNIYIFIMKYLKKGGDIYYKQLAGQTLINKLKLHQHLLASS